MTNLEVPRLKMQHFKMIVPSEDPFPTEPTQRVKFVFCGHITPLPSVRVFQAHGAHSIAHFVEPMRWWFDCLGMWVPRLIGPAFN
jgi:hypothetical protein